MWGAVVFLGGLWAVYEPLYGGLTLLGKTWRYKEGLRGEHEGWE